MKKKLFILILTLALSLQGCGANIPDATEANGAIELWVVTEHSTSDGMNYQLVKAAESFAGIYPDITLRIDILPTDESEREVYLEQIRTQIMAGDGPDVYLLPTENTLTVDSRTKHSQDLQVTEIDVDPLFHDVAQAMYNGVFADIGTFYDEDTDLHTEDLKQDVMDAGVVDGCRYILPLRYTMPVLLTDPSNYEETGITQELIDSGIEVMAEYAIKSDDIMMAIGLRIPDDVTLLPQLFDYENGELVISQQDIADYMRLYQKMNAFTRETEDQLISGHMEELWTVVDESTHHTFEDPLAEAGINITLNSFNDLYEYGRFGYHWSLEGFPLYFDSLTGALDQAAISKVLGKNLQAQPMRSLDGEVIAEVTYYGAVGSNCKAPELAYEFLRIFLTEDYQWDFVRPRTNRENDTQMKLANEVQTDGLIENSLPVRVTGSVANLWDTLQYQNYRESYIYQNYHKALKDQNLDLTDVDLPILQTNIDEVRFPFYQPYEETLTYALTLPNHEDGTPTDVDIEKLTKQIYQYLQWHLEEG